MTPDPEIETARPERMRPQPSWLLSLAAAVLAGVVFLGARNTLVDDAYITLDYARNLAFHLHWGLTTSATANTATSPFNVLVLGLFTAITRRPVLALGIVYVLSNMALEYGLRRAARALGLPGWLGVLTVALVSVNPLLISSIGLEIALGGGLIGLLVAAAVTRRYWWFGIVAGLAVLARPDLVIVVLVVLAFRPGWRAGWWAGLWRSAVGALAVTLPWYLWSWFALGSALPDTLLIKSGQRGWGSNNFANGPELYLGHYRLDAALSFAPAAAGAAAALGWLVLRVVRPTGRVRRLDRLFALPVAGGLHYLGYVVLGVPPYHWYYGPSLICLTAYLAVAIAALWPPAGARVVAWLPGGAGLAMAAVLLAVSVGAYTSAGVPRPVAQITTNWALPRQYAAIGTAVHRLVGNATVVSPGELGELTYFCDCAVLDVFSDPGVADQLINTRLATETGLKRALYEANFRFRDRNIAPVVPRFALQTGPPPAGAMAVWATDSPWIGPDTFSLIRNPNLDANR